LGDGVEEADGDDTETGFTAAFVERAGGNVAGKIAAEGGEFIVHPEGKLGAVAPEKEGTHNEDGVTDAG